ncbi:hypothetical protein BV898_11989 [Hypsibius exemplaris]|uniref:General transcription factor 3C polypeptide 3 n=1 Tax=Hypsibius exemplaris TaxID=2072580 RepID=A0A1W0WEZ8_HYPEX|nr:hypothetical protein BV898_11989 [Hypsibius exemplaris]
MANSPENVTPQGHSREFSAVRSKFTSILGNFKDDEDESHGPAADHATARDSDSDEDMEGLSSRRKKRLRSSVMKGPARLMLNRAEELFERDGDLAGCLEECRAVLTVHGDCERAHGLMAKCHAKLNDIPAALQSTKNIVKLNPNHYKAWSDYFSFAEQLKLTEEGMEALKGLVAVKTGDLSDEEKEDKLTHLNHLILLLESEEGKEDLVIGYQEQLLQLAENLPSVDVFGTAVALAEKYLASGRADRAEKLLEERLEFQLQKVGDQSVPLSILIHGTNIYTLSLSEKQDFKKIWKFCQRHRIVSRSAGAIIFPAAYLKRNSPHSTSLVATICLARLKMSPVDLPLLEWAITDILLVADTFA